MLTSASDRSRRRGCRCAEWVAAALTSVSAGVSHAPAQWSSSFAAPGPDERVRALAMYDDGTGEALYAGGLFDAIDGRPCSKIARLRDGVWSDVGGGVGSNQQVRALLVFNGELVAGGEFESMGGRRVNYIARWDGGEWRSFGRGLPEGVVDLTIFNGQLVATGGFFNSLGSDVAAWDGGAWLPLGDVRQVTRLAVYNGELLAAGHLNMTPISPIARWTGSSWETFAGGIDLNINALTQFKGDLFLGGWNNELGSTFSNGLARWDGRSWHALDGVIGRADAFAVDNGSLIVAGWMQLSGGFSQKGVAIWDGTTWSPPTIVSSGLNPGVNALVSIDDSHGPSFVIGGFFSKAGPICANNLARYSNGQWSRLSECEKCLGLSEPRRGLAVHDDGSGEAVYVAGACQCAGSKPINRVGRWDGRSWSSVGTPFNEEDGSNPYPLTLASFDDGSDMVVRLYLGGYFGTVAGHHAYSVAMWDGREWSDVGGGIYDGTVYDLTVFDDGTGPALYAGGRFSNAGGASIAALAKWDGRQWSEVGGGVHEGAFVIDMMSWDDGSGTESLLIGGRFGSVGGGSATLSAGNIAQWRNGTWSTFGEGLGYPGGSLVRSLAPWPVNGGGFIAGGDFPAPGFGPASGLALWNGAAWQNIAPVTSPGYQTQSYATFSMRTTSCDQLLAFGRYSAGRPLAWNGEIWKPMIGGVEDPMGHWGVQNSGVWVAYANFATFHDRVYFVGDFTSAGGLPASNIAIWDPAAAIACAPDANGDAVIDISDLLAVVTQWGPCATSCAADSAPCGGDGQVNVEDLLAVISSWGPCPP